MRQGYKPGWIIDQSSGDLIGVNLSADCVAEHECGMEGIQNNLGLPTFENENDYYNRTQYTIHGIERRRAKNPNPECISLKEEEDSLNLIVARRHTLKWLTETKLEEVGGLSFFRKEDIISAWDRYGFIVRVKGAKNYKKLRLLHAALMKGEVAVWLGGGGLLENSGLVVCIIDKVSKSKKELMLEVDLEKEKLQDASDATGIKKKIDDLNNKSGDKFKYLALTPGWAKKEDKTSHRVKYWLNPWNEDKFNHDWFTVEQLDLWLQDKGPVMKKVVSGG